MNESIPQPTIALPAQNVDKPARLSGRVLTTARVVWWVTFVSVIVLNVIALPLMVQLLQRECVSVPCYGDQLDPFLFRSWLSFGLTREAYATIALVIGLIPTVIYLVVGLILFRSKADDHVVIFAAFMLVAFGATYSGFMSALARENSLWWIPSIGLEYIGSVCVLVFYYIFPNGLFVPRWTRFAALAFAVEQLLEVLHNPPLGLLDLPPGTLDVAFFLLAATAVFAQFYRYRRTVNPTERRQTKWVVVGTITALVGVLGTVIILSFVPPVQGNAIVAVLGNLLLASFVSLIPVSIGIAILRNRLWDINLIINRALVYGTVTAILAGLLAVSSDLAKRFFLALTGESSELTPILATLVVVAAFDPIRKRVQLFADRHVKYATGTLGAFADELDKFIELNDPHALARRFLKEALTSFDAQSGAIYLGQGAHLRLVTSKGEWQGHAELAVPLEHGGEQVGLVALGARERGVAYDADDRAHLKELGDLVAHAIELAKRTGPEVKPAQPSS